MKRRRTLVNTAGVVLLLTVAGRATAACTWFEVCGLPPDTPVVSVTSGDPDCFLLLSHSPTTDASGCVAFLLCSLDFFCEACEGADVVIALEGSTPRAVSFNCLFCNGTDGSVPATDCNSATACALDGGSPGDAIDVTDCAVDGNDACAGAMPLAPNDYVIGSTVGATAENLGCGNLDENPSPGVWFSVIGTGTEITASTCNPETDYDSAISIWTGACGNLTCYNGAGWLSFPKDPECDEQQTERITWCAEPGVEYLILVSGGAFNGSEGTFALELTTGPACSIPNNECVNAMPVDPDSVTFGSTTGASVTELGPCGNAFDGQGAVWYSVQGTGGLITASIADVACSGQGFAEVPHLVRVYANGCGMLTCVGGDDESVLWCSVAGAEYLIEVHGVDQPTPVQEEGDFALELCSGEACSIPNDSCQDAIRIEADSVTTGTTLGALPPDLGGCPGSDNYGGVWYSVVGTGTDITATTCPTRCSGSAWAEFQSAVQVFEGACGSFTCVGFDLHDAGCGAGDSATVRWCSEPDVEYLVLVTATSSSPGTITEGDFSLELCTTTACPAPNASCFGAIPLPLDTPIAGSTFGAPASQEFGGGTVWYSIMGTGEVMTLSTCPAPAVCGGQGAADYQSRIVVYSGSCQFGIVEEARDMPGGCGGNGAVVRWCSEPGLEYLVMVSGSEDGLFTIEACSEPWTCSPSNNECATAIDVVPGSLYEGSTVGATPAVLDPPFVSCANAPDNDSGALWYRVVGNDRAITASTCTTSTNFSTRLRVIPHCPTSFTECYASSSSSPAPYDALCDPVGLGFNASASVTFCGFAGEDYFIVVDGQANAEGSFGLYLVEEEICAGPRACCLPDGTCIDNLTHYDCSTLDGFWMDPGAECATTDCTGRCCLLDGTCENGHSLDSCTAANGAELLGGYWFPGLYCDDGECSFLVSHDGLWSARISTIPDKEGLIEDLFRNDVGSVSHLYKSFFLDANSAGLLVTNRTYWTMIEGPVIDADRSHAWARYEGEVPDALEPFEVDLQVDHYMISGPSGGVLTVITATNEWIEPIDIQLYAYADIDVNGGLTDYDAVAVLDGPTFVAAEFRDQPIGGDVLWFGGLPPYGGWEIGPRYACGDIPCQFIGLECDLRCGVTGLADADGTPPGFIDHAAAVSSDLVTLEFLESMELRIGMGGQGFATGSDPCPGDITGDGSTGINDLLAVLSAWGPNPGHPADLDGDDQVGIFEFLLVLAQWGPCP